MMTQSLTAYVLLLLLVSFLQRGNTLDHGDSTGVADQAHPHHKTGAAVPVYHADSDSFKIWADQSAAAAAASAAGTGSPGRHTPASSSVLDMAAMLPGSPIGSPLHSNKNSYNNLQGFAGTAQYPDPMAIQQTLTQLQMLMQQQQQMVSMMGSAAAPVPGPQMYPAAAPGYNRVRNPGFDQGFGGSRGVDAVRQLSTSAPGSTSGTPVYGSPAGTPMAGAAGIQRSGAFHLRGVDTSNSASGARFMKMDGSSAGSSSRRLRAVSQHGHQDMLATPFANPSLGPINSK